MPAHRSQPSPTTDRPAAGGRRPRPPAWRVRIGLSAHLPAVAALTVLLSHAVVGAVVALFGWPGSALGTLGVSLVVGVVAAIATLRPVGRWVGHRVERIARALDHARLGDFSQRLEVGLNDEIGLVARRVNHLLETSSLRERRILESALSDPLTGLPNRTLLTERIRRSIAVSHRSRVPFCVALIDIDRFKEINDTLGHGAGDSVLREVASRLRGAIRDTDTAARIGGDEFVLLLDGGEDAAHEVSSRIIAVMRASLAYEKQPVDIGVSIGIAVHPRHGADEATLLRHADAAMYRAKRQRAGVVFFDGNEPEVEPNDLAMMGELRAALEGGGLVLDYQPKLDLTSGLTLGLEGLLRWNHPSRGRVLPRELLGRAEQSVIMREITPWVVDRAAAFAAMLAQRGFALNVSVNVSAQDLEQPGFAAQVAGITRDRGIEAGRLTLEIAEGGLFSGTQTAMVNLKALADQGVRLAIDDFGTGFSTLSQLQQLPVHELKIDRSFVTGMTTNRGSQSVVRSTVDIAKRLGVRTIAEGVETVAELRALAAIGCHEVQGYFVAQPLRAEEVVSWIEMRHALYASNRETYFRSLLGHE